MAFFLLSLLRASLFSYYVFVAFACPLNHLLWLRHPLILLAKALEIPIYLLGLAIPFLRSPAGHLSYKPPLGLDGVVDPTWFLLDHMRTGVLAYLLVFYTPTLFRWARRRRANTVSHQ